MDVKEEEKGAGKTGNQKEGCGVQPAGMPSPHTFPQPCRIHIHPHSLLITLVILHLPVSQEAAMECSVGFIEHDRTWPVLDLRRTEKSVGLL